MRRGSFLILFLLIFPFSLYEATLFEEMASYVVKTEKGSGVIIGTNRILTVAHLIDSNDISKNGVIRKTWITRDNRFITSQLVRFSQEYDLALFETQERFKEFVSMKDAVYGESVYLVGHPFNNDWTIRQAIVSFSNKFRFKTIVITVGSSGDSGGGIFKIENNKIYLAGIIRAGNAVRVNETTVFVGTFLYGIPCSVIQEFLDTLKKEER